MSGVNRNLRLEDGKNGEGEQEGQIIKKRKRKVIREVKGLTRGKQRRGTDRQRKREGTWEKIFLLEDVKEKQLEKEGWRRGMRGERV